jgi:predicted acylesterase/phospholipase RssA
MEIDKIEYLVLSGGGVLGYSYIGLLKYMEEKNMISKIKNIIGCSAGAIFGTLISFGFTSNELYTALISINPSDYFNINLDSFLGLINNKGLDNCDLFINKIKELIAVKTLNPDINFKEMYEKTGIKLQIGVTNINTMKFEICNKETTPEIPIHQALRASIAIPFLIQPVKINGYWYCDGGVSNNYPIDMMIDPIKTLGFYLMNDFEKKETFCITDICIGEYLDKIMKSLSNIIPVLEKYKDNTIIIDIPRNLASPFKFITNKENIAKCIVYGYQFLKKKIENIENNKN